MEHILRESNTWQTALNLILSIEEVSDNFITSALFDKAILGDPVADPNEFTRSLPSRAAILHGALDEDQLEDRSKSDCDLLSLRMNALRTALREGLLALEEWCQNTPRTNETISLWRYSLTAPICSSSSYKVSVHPISIYIPLHRFLGKTIITAAHSNLDLSEFIHSLIERHSSDSSGLGQS